MPFRLLSEGFYRYDGMFAQSIETKDLRQMGNFFRECYFLILTVKAIVYVPPGVYQQSNQHEDRDFLYKRVNLVCAHNFIEISGGWQEKECLLQGHCNDQNFISVMKPFGLTPGLFLIGILLLYQAYGITLLINPIHDSVMEMVKDNILLKMALRSGEGHKDF